MPSLYFLRIGFWREVRHFPLSLPLTELRLIDRCDTVIVGWSALPPTAPDPYAAHMGMGIGGMGGGQDPTSMKAKLVGLITAVRMLARSRCSIRWEGRGKGLGMEVWGDRDGEGMRERGLMYVCAWV